MKKTLMVVAMMLGAGSALAAFTSEYDFEVSNGIITRYRGIPDHPIDVRIPPTIFGQLVTGIGNGAFTYKWLSAEIMSVTIPASVTSIGDGAFQNHQLLTSVTVMAVEPPTAGADMFAGCSNLGAIYVPGGSVESYKAAEGWKAYANMIQESPAGSELNPWKIGAAGHEAEVTAWMEDGTLIIAGTCAMNNFDAGSTPWYGVITSIYKVEIRSGVTSIGNNSFNGCSSLTSVTIPAGVTNIGDNAFNGCSSLTSVTIPAGVTSIGDNVFQGCSKLTSVTIPAGVTNISNNAFNGCSSLTSVTIPAGVTNIGNNAFNGCSLLTSVTIPASVTSIGDSAFNGCSSLTSVTVLADEPPTAGDDMFEECPLLTVIYVPVESVESYKAAEDGWSKYKEKIRMYPTGSEANPWLIGTEGHEDEVTAWIKDGTKLIIAGVGAMKDFVFKETPWYDVRQSIREVEIRSGVTSIGVDAFRGFSSLMSATIPASVTSIGDNAFQVCSSLTSVTIPAGVTSIGNGAFNDCSSLTSVTIPMSVTSIGDSAFQSCLKLTRVTIPASVTNIGDSAFNGCSSLTSVTIPASVTSIGDSAFIDCPALTSVMVLAITPPTIEMSTFLFCSALKAIYVPGESVDRYKAAAWWGEEEYVDKIQELPKGCELDPWKIGTAGHEAEVTAWTDGPMLIIDGMGAMTHFASAAGVPWNEAAGAITELQIAEGVNGDLGTVLATLPNLAYVNGLSVSMLPRAAIAPAEFERVKVAENKVKLRVSVSKSNNPEAASWSKATIEGAKVENDGEVTLTVPADFANGYMILKTKDAESTSGGVKSAQTVGMLSVQNSAKQAAVGVPFGKIGGHDGPPDQDAVSVAEVLGAMELAEGDIINVYDREKSAYQAWEWKNGGWSGVKTVTADGTTEPPPAGNVSLPRGSTFWLERKNTENPIILAGRYVAGEATAPQPVIEPGSSAQKAWNLVANPKGESFDLNAVVKGDIGAKDQILVPTEGAPVIYTYENGAWGCMVNEKVDLGGGLIVISPKRSTAAERTTIPAGRGFWYISAGGQPQFEW